MRVYSLAVEPAKAADVNESVPRTSGRQKNYCNVRVFYCMRQCTCTIPTLDYLISEINVRFISTLSSAIIQIKVLVSSMFCEQTQILR